MSTKFAFVSSDTLRTTNLAGFSKCFSKYGFGNLMLMINLASFSVMIYFSGLINPQAVNKCVQ